MCSLSIKNTNFEIILRIQDNFQKYGLKSKKNSKVLRLIVYTKKRNTFYLTYLQEFKWKPKLAGLVQGYLVLHNFLFNFKLHTLIAFIMNCSSHQREKNPICIHCALTSSTRDSSSYQGCGGVQVSVWIHYHCIQPSFHRNVQFFKFKLVIEIVREIAGHVL